jgi:cytochrome c oxidase cbb3-type subunit 3
VTSYSAEAGRDVSGFRVPDPRSLIPDPRSLIPAFHICRGGSFTVLSPGVRIVASVTVILCAFLAGHPAAQGRGAGASPASQRPPQAKTPQKYPPEQVKLGESRFAAQCASCHGFDAAGGDGGTDLTRSTLVSEDVRGDKLGPLVRTGRPDKGMPAQKLSDADLAAIVAFLHDRQERAASMLGGRRSVDESDLQTGNADAGRRYFDTACTRCHSATGDLAGVATRFRGLQLLQRMLYPGTGGGGAVKRPSVTVTTSSGQTITGTLAYRDEFVIALTDADGWYRSWPTRQVKFTVDDPLEGHVELLGRYTDSDMHDVLAFLRTLK